MSLVCPFNLYFDILFCMRFRSGKPQRAGELAKEYPCRGGWQTTWRHVMVVWAFVRVPVPSLSLYFFLCFPLSLCLSFFMSFLFLSFFLLLSSSCFFSLLLSFSLFLSLPPSLSLSLCHSLSLSPPLSFSCSLALLRSGILC